MHGDGRRGRWRRGRRLGVGVGLGPPGSPRDGGGAGAAGRSVLPGGGRHPGPAGRVVGRRRGGSRVRNPGGAASSRAGAGGRGAGLDGLAHPLRPRGDLGRAGRGAARPRGLGGRHLVAARGPDPRPAVSRRAAAGGGPARREPRGGNAGHGLGTGRRPGGGRPDRPRPDPGGSRGPRRGGVVGPSPPLWSAGSRWRRCAARCSASAPPFGRSTTSSSPRGPTSPPRPTASWCWGPPRTTAGTTAGSPLTDCTPWPGGSRPSPPTSCACRSTGHGRASVRGPPTACRTWSVAGPRGLGGGDGALPQRHPAVAAYR
jgi:hypothetical protein